MSSHHLPFSLIFNQNGKYIFNLHFTATATTIYFSYYCNLSIRYVVLYIIPRA